MMSKNEQSNHLTKLLKPDVVVKLDKKITQPFDLLQLQKELNQTAKASAIESIVDQVIAENPGSAQDYRNGKKKAIGFLVGQVMRATKGKANPQLVNQTLRQRLEKQ